MMSTRTLAALLTGACLTALPAVPPAVVEPAAATRPTAAASAASPDFDGDGRADLAAVLNLDRDSGAWAIRVWYGAGATQDITSADLGGSTYSIGGALLARDLDADGYTDLVLGFGKAVQIVPGTASGLAVDGRHLVPVTTATDSGVATLALVGRPVARLAVGIDSDAGTEVRVFRLGGDGLPSGDPIVLRAGRGKLPSITNAASFGWSMVGSGNRLFIGTPYARVSGKREAGVVTAVTFSASAVSAARNITQATTGVTGAVGTTDHFGYSLAARDGYLAVGTPGDDVGAALDTGSVQLFSLAGGGLKAITRLSESSPGVPGKSESHDFFGGAVDLATTCGGVTSVVVGGPAEVITAGHEADGAAWVVPLKKATGCTAVQVYEGHGLTGTPTTLAGLGEFVGVLRDAGSTVDDLVLGGRGDLEDGVSGRIVRWSPSAGETASQQGIFRRVAGR